MEPMLCPSCKTNRTRFNMIEQNARPVKVDPQTGDIQEEYSGETAGPFHLLYHGPSYKVQCATCGLIENPEMFIKMAQSRSV
ncbi:MAG: DNA alkylation repair protein [Ectobacillus sp.]